MIGTQRPTRPPPTSPRLTAIEPELSDVGAIADQYAAAIAA
jgi:hypothetical protein